MKPKHPRGRGKSAPTRTPSSEAILGYIEESLRDHGRPPTLREIGAAFGIASTNGVRYHLDRLERDGKIRRARFTSRGIEVPVAGGRGAGHTDNLPPPPPAFPRATDSLFEIPLLSHVAPAAPVLPDVQS